MAHQAYPRDLAVRVLTRVLSDHQPLDEAIAAVSGELSHDARGWLQEVCSGTLRWRGRIENALDTISLKKKPSGWLRKMLMVGAYQLIAQDRINPAFVVSETVNEIKRKEGDLPANFANALLRKVAEHGAQWRALPFPKTGSPAEKAQWASLPEWLWWRLIKAYGEDWAQAYALASLERPTLWIRRKSSDQPEKLQPGTGPVTARDGFAGGDFFVQDISSQTLVREVSDEVKRVLGPVVSALDLCAAPGGKSAGMAWSGLQVTSSDLEPPRMALLKQTLDRTAPGVRVVEPKETEGLKPQDLVWVDSPCTGTGILRRHPDVRWLRQEKELYGLEKTQQELIKKGWNKVKAGGFLAYSVCSVLREEGEGAIKKAGLTDQVVKTWFLVPQNVPHGDGFWAALIRKPG